MTGGIRISGLRKHYGEVRAVDGVDIDIAAGEVVALLGPNGAGKSTTIDMLLGLTRPDAGQISIFGMTPEQATASGAVGAMLQTGSLIQGLTVRELIEMLAALYPKAMPVDDVLKRARIDDIANRRSEKLSGGQTQRVRFAMALVPDPDVLVLDEPTVAMDVETRHAFWGSMREFATSGRTVLFATHYLDEADAFADRIVLISQGVIVADGPTTEIKATVGGRTIRATLPGADATALELLPGVSKAEVRGDSVLLHCSDSDAAVRALLAGYPAARDLEISGADLEQAFLTLTEVTTR
jgi:ABC-2 type transport system ATP-binding protein